MEKIIKIKIVTISKSVIKYDMTYIVSMPVLLHLN